MANKKDKDLESHVRVHSILKELGIPVIQAEGNILYLSALKGYLLTPDFIQCPFIGNGSSLDFFMDLNCPDVNFLVKKTEVGKLVSENIKCKINVGVSNKEIMQQEIQRIADSFNKKTEKYSVSRNNSPLFGWITYFNLSGSSIPSVAENNSISWHLSESNVDDFILEFYIYFFYITAIDRIMGTGLYVEKIITDEKWKNGLQEAMDRLKFKNDEKLVIESKLHDKCSFFLLLIELPGNKFQRIFFYNSRIFKSTDKRISDNLIVINLKNYFSI